MPASFLYCAVYGLALAVLILSHLATWSVLELFIAKPYVIGTHTVGWMNWHAIGCAFVGVMNLLARHWTDVRARRDVAAGTAGIYGIWALQNLWLVTTHDGFLPFMWVHVVGCALATGASVASVRILSADLKGGALAT